MMFSYANDKFTQLTIFQFRIPCTLLPDSLFISHFAYYARVRSSTTWCS